MTDIPTTSEVEQLSPTVTREWVCNHQIVIFTIKDVSMSTLDVWFKATADVIKNYPPDRDYLSMHDFTSKKFGMTRTLMARAHELFQLRGDLKLKGRFAGVISKTSIMSQMALLFIRLYGGRTMRLQAFFTREEALAWLKEGLGDNQC